MACNCYYCTQFIAQAQGCGCTALQLDGNVEQPWLWLMSKYDVIHKPEVHNVSLHHQRRNKPWPYLTSTKIGEDRTCSSGDMLVNRQTHRHTDRQTDAHHNTPPSYRGRSNKRRTIGTTDAVAGHCNKCTTCSASIVTLASQHVTNS